MRKVFASIASALLFVALFSTTTHAANSVKSGSSCSKIGQLIKASSVELKCVKTKGKTIWTSINLSTVSPTQIEKTSITPSTVINSEPNPVATPTPIATTDPTMTPAATSITATNTDGFQKIDLAGVGLLPTGNVQSPQNISTCRPPDLRGALPANWDPHAITYPVKNAGLPSSGIITFAVAGVDFSDVPGTGQPSDIYGPITTKISDWFDYYSNGKLKVKWITDNKWHRADGTSDGFNWAEVAKNVGPAPANSQEVIQKLFDTVDHSIDFSNVDSVLFVYPQGITTIEQSLTMQAGVSIPQNPRKLMMVMATSEQTYNPPSYLAPLWAWVVHENLHPMGLVQHFPVNPPSWNIEYSVGYSYALTGWSQNILDWLTPNEIFCADKSDVTGQILTLVPAEREEDGLRTIQIRISNSQVLVVESHRKDQWSGSPMLPDTYGTMVYVVDTTKNTDRTGESTDDDFTGNKYSRTGVYLTVPGSPFNNSESPQAGNLDHAWGALMQVGDSISYGGVRVTLIHSDSHDTVKISQDQ